MAEGEFVPLFMYKLRMNLVVELSILANIQSSYNSQGRLNSDKMVASIGG